MAARKAIHESCQEQRAYIADVDRRAQQKDEEMTAMADVMKSLDADIAQLQEELKRAKRRTDELQQQKQACLQEYEAITGQPCDRLLAHFTVVPTLPPLV